jgi:glycosyltransferase involved in cell wall biosynthesis
MPGANQAPWVLVAGGFHSAGGMDQLNAAVARGLIERGIQVHLVAHQIELDLATTRGVTAHLVNKSAGSFFLGQRQLDRRGRAIAAQAISRDPATRVLVNGVNCAWSDLNWVHFVNHAWPPRSDNGPLWLRWRSRFESVLTLRRERAILPGARLLVANSATTRSAIIERFGIPSERVVTVYPGSDARYAPPESAQRVAARASFGVTDRRPIVVFVGALGHDPRKGFDTLWAAWRRLCARREWRAILIVAGGGRAVARWRQTVKAAGMPDRVLILGFTEAIATVLAAADLLVSPVRYEPYGLNVHEAISCGVPAVVSACAGVAERYPVELHDMLIADPEDGAALAARLLEWSGRIDSVRDRFESFSRMLRSCTVEAMANQLIGLTTDGSERRERESPRPAAI